MERDFYCDEVLSGKTSVKRILETNNVLAFYHTKPSYQVHIVVIPKQHVTSLLELKNKRLLVEIINVLQKVAAQVVREHGACRIITNLGDYQDSKHLHWHVVFGEKLTDSEQVKESR